MTATSDRTVPGGSEITETKSDDDGRSASEPERLRLLHLRQRLRLMF
jgi:hypothetical protein